MSVAGCGLQNTAGANNLMITLTLVLIVFGATTFGLTGLLAAWVALGRGHWFARTAGLAAWIGAWLLVPAHEIVAVLAVQSLVVVPPLALARRLRNREPGGPLVQFALRDLFLLTVVVAVVVAVGAATPASVWTSWEFFDAGYGARPIVAPWLVYPAIGVVAGLTSLLAVWGVVGRCRLWKRLVALLVAFPLGAFGAFEFSVPRPRLLSGVVLAVATPVPWRSAGLCVFLGLPVLLTVWLAIFLLLRGAPAAGAMGRSPALAKVDRPRWRRAGRYVAASVLVLLSLVLLAPPTAVWYAIVAPPPIPEEVLPVPNGYDVLVRVGGQLENVTVPENDEYGPAQQQAAPAAFRAFRRQHDASLAEVRAALDVEWRVRVTYDADRMHLYRAHLEKLRKVARSLTAAGEAARLDGDYAAAAGYGLDTIRLGQAGARGGLLFELFCAISAESRGLRALHTRHESLPEMVRWDVIRKLRDLRDRREPLDDCLQRDRIWASHAHGWQGRLTRAISHWNGEEATLFEAAERTGLRTDALLQILVGELALANYRDEHGRQPPTLAALVPGYLDEAPRDPFGQGPLVYRLTEKGYELYSVGPNGVDDGRRATQAGDPDGDDVWFW